MTSVGDESCTLQMVVWLVLGMVIDFSDGRHHRKMQAALRRPAPWWNEPPG
jgi:hypothetical protein